MEGIFHVHSNYSSDGRLSLEELKEECIKRGLSFMVMTDHAEDFPPGKVKEFVNHCREISDENFFAVPGLEFNVDKDHEVHLLVVGLEDFVSEDRTEEILKKIRKGESSTLTVMAHLSRSNHYIPTDYENRINGIEIWNAAYNSRYLPDQKAMRLFTNLKKKNSQLVGFGGLDLHDHSGFRELKICLTNSCHNEKELLDDLRAGKFKIRGQYMSLSSQPTSGFWLMTILGLGRKVLVAADFLRWKAITIVRACRVLK